ncbi:M24/M37 family peptidase [Campylobacter sputorum subsp. bubulus]|uniref:M24/M37 family peptidase n=1 Tax=Campylobacter sputorum subsp. sputorum TaxID=32024 RepID=A0A381DGT3_9BACT|nr:zinc metallopeptidase, M23 family [Campylobacter sputorum aubsp. sputorum RM3237]ASM36634.1 zinc metallopeptidase, M23 family [Campylobacter sputorum bv. faecalis CCUG 20703]KAB0581898.1 peptidoglycan DD-metalloendopeptidase family protein [Campylobacter sputorum subsp. sputorum]SUX30766.1 M24/M37 family peptidase [Campylobacter sputorum subsp. bubulus]QEL05165.1 zinc metallopeptidase, M23 family [Campylobacter sputorum subsp. sputorum]
MKDRFIITISDTNGTRHLTMHKLIKKIVIYIIAFVVFSFIFGILYISILSNQTKDLSKKRNELLKIKHELILENEKIQQQLDRRTEDFKAIEDKIADMEEQIGLTSDDNVTLSERIDDIKVTTYQMNAIFSQIPNGDVIDYKRTSARFGWRNHPILKRKEFHPGIDLAADIGTPIYAPADGVVELAEYNANNGFGYLVVIVHNYGFKTRYAHMSRKDVVKQGQFIKKGDLIGYSGNTGLSTGPHLHYEVRFIQKPLDPANFIKWDSKNFEEIFKKEGRVPWQSLIKAITNQLPKQQ